MQDEYSIFRKFTTLAQANELSKLLSINGIETQLADNIALLDITFSGSTLQNEIEVRIHQVNFEKAEELLKKEAANLINDIDRNYYLFDYKNEELYDILFKYDEWNEFDYSLAQKILKERGRPLSSLQLQSFKDDRIKILSKPFGNQKPWIIAGYIFAVLGGFLGLIIGCLLWTSIKTLPNGQKVYSHATINRLQGKFIFIISIIVLPSILLLRFAHIF